MSFYNGRVVKSVCSIRFIEHSTTHVSFGHDSRMSSSFCNGGRVLQFACLIRSICMSRSFNQTNETSFGNWGRGILFACLIRFIGSSTSRDFGNTSTTHLGGAVTGLVLCRKRAKLWLYDRIKVSHLCFWREEWLYEVSSWHIYP